MKILSTAVLALTVPLFTSVTAMSQTGPVANPSRPTVTNSPDLGPVRVLQLEAGVSQSDADSASLAFLAKYTLSARWEVRIGTSVLFPDGRHDVHRGDSTLHLQFLPSVPAVGNGRWAVFATVKAPSASNSGGGTGEWDGVVGLATGVPLGQWRLDGNVTAGFEGHAGATAGISAAAYRTLTRRMSLFVDTAFAATSNDGGAESYRQMIGASFAAAPSLIFDLSLQWPLTEGSGDGIVQVGVSAAQWRRR